MADISKIKLPDNTEYEIKDAKARMVILSYGNSTWQDFLTDYQNNCVVYCRASSNSNPATGSQTRMAFMAYISDATNPTNVEFQYYRSMNKHTDAQQGDQIFVYKLTNANKWTVTTRNAFSKVIAGDNITSSFVESETNSSITLAADYDSTVTENSTKLITSGAVYDAIANQPVPDLADLPDVTITTPSNGQVLTYDSSNQEWINANSSGGSSTLSGLSDVDLTTPTDGQILTYDSSNQEWVNSDNSGKGSVLTQAQYDALVVAGTVDPNETYYISDGLTPSFPWVDLTSTLTAGSTSLVFSASAITTNSTIDIYVDDDFYGVVPSAVTLATGSVTLTFEAQSSDMPVKVRVS